MNDNLDARQLPGARLVGPDHERIGKIGQVFLGGQARSPQWVRVHMGLLGRTESLVPLAGAQLADGVLHIPYGKDQIRDAPAVDGNDGHLTPAEEAALYRYYGLATGTYVTSATSAQEESRRWTQESRDGHVAAGPGGDGRAPGQLRQRSAVEPVAEPLDAPARPPRHAAPGRGQDDADLERAIIEADLYEAGRLATVDHAPVRRGKHVR